MEESKWDDKPAKRYVAFFDIMGFKEMVERNDHKDVVAKLQILKSKLKTTEKFQSTEAKDIKGKISESKSVTFSDSIIIFTKGSSKEDLCKILLDSSYIIHQAILNGIGIKGAISYGEVTVDFENSLFFGRPIIDAYLLHEQLNLYTAVIDNNVEREINGNDIPETFKRTYTIYKTPFKSGKINHMIMAPPTPKTLAQQLEAINKIYETVSGAPRIYVDNTIELFNSLKHRDK